MSVFSVERLSGYARLMRLDKPIGTLLLLWPTLWALWIAADGVPPLHIVLIFAVGTLLMRSAGCVMNDYADRDFDGHVARTHQRPLVTGAVSRGEAIGLAAGLSFVSLLLVLPLDPLVIWLSLPALFLAVSYPLTKRFLAIPQAYLGIAFGFGIPMGFAAVQGQVPLIGWALLLANIFWAVAYDTEYAMVDREDDLKIGIKTAAITFGRFDVIAVMICYVATFAILGMIGWVKDYGSAYYLGLMIAAGMALYHYFLIRSRKRDGCFKAFLHNNWVGAAIFAGLFVDHMLRAGAG